MGQVHFFDLKIFPLGASEGGSAPKCILGTPRISESIRVRKLKLYTHLDGSSALFGSENFSVRGAGVAAPPTVNLGPLSYLGNY